jgi:hypothetical protein
LRVLRAFLRARHIPSHPEALSVGAPNTGARRVRHIEDGFAIEFTRLQHSDFIEGNVTGE